MQCIEYNGGYKYQLKKPYSVEIAIRPSTEIDTDYIKLSLTGTLTIEKGYAWDGPSGPTIDTPTFMRGSLVHDALYQLMREKKLDKDLYRESADRILQQLCLEDGMLPLRAWWVYQAVRRFADPAASDPQRPPKYAPEGCTS